MAGRGKLIVLCGIDGSGKSTQEELLATRIRATGQEVVCTRQPSSWYRNLPQVRSYLDNGKSALSVTSIALLAAADRLIHIDEVITPALERGTHVLCNRYVYSSYGYFWARGASREFVANINAAVPEPDLGILLRISPEEAVRRVIVRADGQKFEERDADYLKVVQDEMARRWPERFLTIDAARPVADLADAIAEYVLPQLESDTTDQVGSEAYTSR